MDDNSTDKIVKIVTTSGILATLTAACRAMLVDSETPMRRLRTFLAGVFIGVFLGYILIDVNLKEFYKNAIVGVGGAFISTAWPILEKIFKKWLDKKGNNVVSNTDVDKHTS